MQEKSTNLKIIGNLTIRPHKFLRRANELRLI